MRSDLTLSSNIEIFSLLQSNPVGLKPLDGVLRLPEKSGYSRTHVELKRRRGVGAADEGRRYS